MGCIKFSLYQAVPGSTALVMGTTGSTTWARYQYQLLGKRLCYIWAWLEVESPPARRSPSGAPWRGWSQKRILGYLFLIVFWSFESFSSNIEHVQTDRSIYQVSNSSIIFATVVMLHTIQSLGLPGLSGDFHGLAGRWSLSCKGYETVWLHRERYQMILRSWSQFSSLAICIFCSSK